MSKNLGKWIANNTIEGSKFRLTNDQFLRGRNVLGTADINLLKVNANDRAEFGAEPVSSFAPSTPNSLVNRQYVLDALAGIRDPKDAVRLATAAALPAYTPAGTGVGKTLTADANGALSLDGELVLAGDRVGVLTEGVHNGIYIVTDTGDAGTPFILTRATDADTDEEVNQGMSFDVVEGTSLGRTRWLLTTATITLDTTSLTFVETPNPSAIVQFKTEEFLLAAGDITNGYIDLANLAETQSILVYPVGGPVQRNGGVDYSTSVPTTVTRITFAGDFATTLEAGDTVVVKYAHF